MGIAGRLGLGPLGERGVALCLFKAATFLMAASYALWLSTDSFHPACGFRLGSRYWRIAVVPVVMRELFGSQSLGAILGIFFTATGIASLAGPSAARAIFDRTDGYRWAVAFAMAMAMLGFAVCLPLKAARTRSLRL